MKIANCIQHFKLATKQNKLRMINDTMIWSIDVCYLLRFNSKQQRASIKPYQNITLQLETEQKQNKSKTKQKQNKTKQTKIDQ